MHSDRHVDMFFLVCPANVTVLRRELYIELPCDVDPVAQSSLTVLLPFSQFEHSASSAVNVSDKPHPTGSIDRLHFLVMWCESTLLEDIVRGPLRAISALSAQIRALTFFWVLAAIWKVEKCVSQKMGNTPSIIFMIFQNLNSIFESAAETCCGIASFSTSFVKNLRLSSLLSNHALTFRIRILSKSDIEKRSKVLNSWPSQCSHKSRKRIASALNRFWPLQHFRECFCTPCLDTAWRGATSWWSRLSWTCSYQILVYAPDFNLCGLLILWRQRCENTQFHDKSGEHLSSKSISLELLRALFCISTFRDSEFGSDLFICSCSRPT